MKKTPAGRLTESYKVGQTQSYKDFMKFYDKWDQYESDVMGIGFMGPIACSSLMYKHVDPKARILDVGCGPGNMGRHLELLKFKNLYGVDGSKGMVKKAIASGHYKKVFQGICDADTPLPIKNIDAILGVGVFTVSHFPSGTMQNHFEQLNSKGYLCFSGTQKVLETTFKKDLQYIKKYSKLVDVTNFQNIVAFADASHRFPARGYLFQKK